MAKKDTAPKGAKTTSVRRCSCQSKQQDSMYGQGARLHNATRKGTHRCTVCGSTK